jgi:hypothetical protein
MIHIGVDLHQRFCYMTAVNASGKAVQAGAVENQRLMRTTLRWSGGGRTYLMCLEHE